MKLAAQGLYAAPYPDKFVIADSLDGEAEYIIRLAAPRFTARIGSDDLFPEGLHYAKGEGEIFYDILWLDTPPPRDQWVDHFKAAGDALDRYTAAKMA
jgi:hypothetical protein